MSTALLSSAAFLAVFLVVWLVGGKRSARRAQTEPLLVAIPEGLEEKQARGFASLLGCLLWTVPGIIAGLVAAGLVWGFLP